GQELLAVGVPVEPRDLVTAAPARESTHHLEARRTDSACDLPGAADELVAFVRRDGEGGWNVGRERRDKPPETELYAVKVARPGLAESAADVVLVRDAVGHPLDVGAVREVLRELLALRCVRTPLGQDLFD